MPESRPPETSPPVKTLSDLMQEKSGALKPDDSVETAGNKMRAANQETAPVTEDRRLVGMIDCPHPDREAIRYGHDPETTKVSESMNREAIFCFEDEHGARALELMISNGLQSLPVVDRDMRIVGMVTREDLAGE